MAATLAKIRADLGTLLSTITGLEVDNKPRGRIEVPCVQVGLPETISYQVTFGGAHADYIIPVRLYVSRYDLEEGTAALDQYLLPTGALSIIDAIEAAGATSGWDFCKVSESVDFGAYTMQDGIDYLGCEFTVRIVAA